MNPNRTKLLALALVLVSTITAARGSDTQPTGMMLPFTENFASTTLDPAWTVHLAKGNLLQVADGVLKLEARPGTRAHFERKLGKDMVRTSCSIQSTGPDATASLFVYWDASNYTEIGFNRPGPGRMEAPGGLGTHIGRGTALT